MLNYHNLIGQNCNKSKSDSLSSLIQLKSIFKPLKLLYIYSYIYVCFSFELKYCSSKESDFICLYDMDVKHNRSLL
jgi:hypothetical protein